jgi:hypothetical protein
MQSFLLIFNFIALRSLFHYSITMFSLQIMSAFPISLINAFSIVI